MQEEQNTQKSKTPIVLGWLFILAAVWLLWSGIYKPLIVGLGALSCLLTIWLAHRTGFFQESTALHLLPRIPFYWAKLFVEIIKSSIEVTLIVLNPKLPISPILTEMKSEPKGPIGQTILGNSITLTPGTVTLDIYDDTLRIHCLTQKGAEELVSGRINQRTAELTDK